MGEWLTVSIVVLVLLVLLGIVFLVLLIKKKKEGVPVETDYRAMFFMGVTFTGVGVALAASTDNPGLIGITALGIIYMISGMANRDKWKDNGAD